MTNKPRIIKDFDKLAVEVQEQIKLSYPEGFVKNLISFKNIKGEYVSALPFETDENYYLVRMTKSEAKEIIEEDDDYDEDGTLKDDVMEEYSDKYDSDEEDDIINEATETYDFE